MARDDPQMKIRLPGELKDEIDLAARSAGRTLNAEVVARLQESVDGTTGLHLPEEILKRLRKAAKETGRTVDGELFARMIESLADMPPAEARLREALEEERKRNARLTVELEEAQTEAWKRTTMLYVLLDTNGYPISWAEIHEHLRGIKQAGGFDPDQMHTNIITPDMESSSRRASEAATLAKLWRMGGRPTMAELPDSAKLLTDRVGPASTEKESVIGERVIRRTRKPERAGISPVPSPNGRKPKP